jgi:uncharacterized membrane protein YhaH (DUF805 family)
MAAKITFKEAVESGFKNFKVFTGRSSRPEYWYWALFVVIVGFLTAMLDSVLFGFPQTPPGAAAHHASPLSFARPFNLIANLILIIPSFAVAARRAQDAGIEGKLVILAGAAALVLNFVPLLSILSLVIFIGLLILFCKPGEADTNKFGPPPASTGTGVS